MISSQGLLDTTMIRFVHTLTYPQPKSNFRIAILNRYNQTQPSYLNDHYLNANIVITLIWNNVLISKKLDFLGSRKFFEKFLNKCWLSGATRSEYRPIRGRYKRIKLVTKNKFLEYYQKSERTKVCLQIRPISWKFWHAWHQSDCSKGRYSTDQSEYGIISWIIVILVVPIKKTKTISRSGLL